MKININGKTREMTEAEKAEMEQFAALIPTPIKSELEERLEKLEALFNKIAALLGVNK